MTNWGRFETFWQTDILAMMFTYLTSTCRFGRWLWKAYVSSPNSLQLLTVLQPPDSAYSTGTFVLYIDMEEDYPAFPPKCRFITPIYHPNINRHGKVCHSILDRG